MRSSARLNKEFGDLTTSPIERVEVAFQGDDCSKWDAKVQGPVDSPYEDGTFTVELDFTDNYPFKAPKVLFKTKIYHPNVKTDTGEICTQAIEKNWVPTQNAKFVIESIISLMASPRPDDALEQEIAEKYLNDYDGFVETAKSYTSDFAS